MTRSFEGKVVVVSGAAGGVGRAAVSLFIENGAKVCATDISPAVAELEREAPGDIVAVVADVTKAADVETIFATAEQRLGPVDVLVSNAGFIISKSAHDTAEDEWDRVMDANAKSFFLMSRRALPSMLARARGSIVATGSISSVVGLPEQAAYCAAKGALLQLVRQMAVDYASRGIRVNAVGAGSINTPFLTRYLEGLDDPAAGEAAIRSAHPIGRWAEPKEIADAILYLAGPGASFVTGHILMADGGYSAR
ncbi:SDR family NAD(P)-dependent oxidoreductase [Labrys wisconsinensis]|uniref:NAD(P)-dependent dehydrogenase (Short-subunit alcohol dehydrogenase family) n=1 Tax=Labrys wisconsinensis TaxID=425677 RepID=A0ABU0J5V2_9HYPH|nr:SDR family oxidoreductase [Labrys wisconsinensis]MDQ0469647.1 NAD(P)-dependent dehydrogenase (short-subunit alcohol dehydrogenase family) [Labrys wisconsinensis]